jgi:hypothetical protein
MAEGDPASNVSILHAMLFVDRDFMKYDTSGNIVKVVRFSDFQDPVFDLLGMLGGATMPEGVSVPGCAVVSVRCHDLGFPFITRQYYRFIVRGYGESPLVEVRVVEDGSMFVPACYYTFISREESIELMKSIFLDILLSSSINLAHFAKNDMKRLLVSSVDRDILQGASKIVDGAFVFIEASGNYGTYSKVFDVMPAGKCSMK